jgi:hypothetical protein
MDVPTAKFVCSGSYQGDGTTMHKMISVSIASFFVVGLTLSVGFADPPASSPPAPASAASGPSSDTSAPPVTVKPDDTKLIVCHVTPPPTGSHMGGGRVCKTKAEWDQETEASQDYIRRGAAAQVNQMGGGH